MLEDQQTEVQEAKGTSFLKTCFNMINALTGSYFDSFISVPFINCLKYMLNIIQFVLNSRTWAHYNPLRSFENWVVKPSFSYSYWNDNLLCRDLTHQMLERRHINEDLS